MKWNVANISIDNQIVVAPMAGVTDSAYRKILKEHGAGLLYTEMVSDKGIIHRNEKTLAMLVIENHEKPIALQLFGSNPDTMAFAAGYVSRNSNADIIDINFGCPIGKVTKGGAGVKLMQDLDLSEKIIKAVVSSSLKPVTIKIRSGWDNENINAVQLAKRAETAGISAIAVHPRTRTQLYSGHSDWRIISEIKRNVKIPVIGNGDIKTPEDAIKMIQETNCDAVMIGRGVLGNPWLIKQTKSLIEKGFYEEHIPLEERKYAIINHLDLLVNRKGERLALMEMRSHGPWYIKGLKNSAAIRAEIVSATSLKCFKDIIDRYFKFLYDCGSV